MITVALFLCTVTGVYDGDTLTCADKTRVRLSAIDAPEIRGCRGRKGRVCVPGDAQASKRALSAMVLGKQLRCEKVGVSYNRSVAFCSAPGVGDLSCAMMRGGWAQYQPKYDKQGRLRRCR